MLAPRSGSSFLLGPVGSAIHAFRDRVARHNDPCGIATRRFPPAVILCELCVLCSNQEKERKQPHYERRAMPKERKGDAVLQRRPT